MDDSYKPISSPSSDSKSQLSIVSPAIKCYITEIVIRCIQEVATSKQFLSAMTQMSLEVFTSQRDNGEALLLKKISPHEWKCNCLTKVMDELAITVALDSAGNVGHVHLGKTEIDDIKLNERLKEGQHEFVIQQTADAIWMLKFEICLVHIEGTGNNPSRTFRDAVVKDPEILFSLVLELSDDVTDKSFFLTTCGDYFLECFHKTKGDDDINKAVFAYEQVVHRQPNHNFKNEVNRISSADTEMPRHLNNFAYSLLRRFEHTGNIGDLSEAISAQQKVVCLTPHCDVKMPPRLINLGASLSTRFERTGNGNDISDAISAQKQAIDLTHEGHAEMASRLNGLVISLHSSFVRTGNLADFSDAISAQRKAIFLTPEGHPDMSLWLSNLGNLLRRRFAETGNLDDITEAIESQQKAIDLSPEEDPDRPALLNNLGISLSSRFGHTGNISDISDAIALQQKAISLIPRDHAELSRFLNNLGISLSSRFDRTGNLADISSAISTQQDAVLATPIGHAEMHMKLTNLAVSLHSRFQRTENVADISEAILFQQKAIKLIPEGHADMPSLLDNVGIYFSTLFQNTGDIKDISEAISSQQKAVNLTPEGHGKMPHRLNNLGISLQCRFQHTGNLADISEAISVQQKAVHLTPEGHASMPRWLSNLGNSLSSRFERTANLNDISEAISALKKSISLTPDGHAEMPGWLNNLGISLTRRFECTGNLTDISEAILAQKRGVNLTPEGHSARRRWLSNLGTSLFRSFERRGDRNIREISEAISAHREALDLAPEGHPQMATFLNNLGISLSSQFDYTKDMDDISEAILIHQKAVDLTPDSHADRPGWLSNLANSLLCRFNLTRDLSDINTSISNFRLAAISSSGRPSVKLRAAQRWVELARQFDSPHILDAHSVAIQLVSHVAGLEQTIQNRHSNLLDISNLSTSAAASAFELERPDLALEWLEQGRCLVWSQLNNLRTPLDTLSNRNPILAAKVLRVSRDLENAGARQDAAEYIADTTLIQRISIQEQVNSHVQLAQAWDRLLSEVRAIPGLEDFLQPLPSSALLENISNSGIVMVINVHQGRCDGLALKCGVNKPLHIPLPDFSYSKADTLRGQLKSYLGVSGFRLRSSEYDARGMRYASTSGDVLKEILSELWTCVVKPILNGLGYLKPPAILPRIWWCVTGPLAFLPIHAAGVYDRSTTASTLSNFAISSYTPSVRALVDRVRAPRVLDEKRSGLFMISQPDTPTLPPIPATTEEVRIIERQLKDRDIQVLCLERDAATVNQIITNMETHSCVHFACHSSQNCDEPLKSGFALHDGRLELSSIIQQRLVGADLAFLSACQTSAGDEKLSEEAVHLAAGMLAAGYRGVVATMWSIKDKYGPIVAGDFYQNLIKDSEGLSGETAAQALHYATQKLRKTLDDSDSAFLTWVPYVHFGL